MPSFMAGMDKVSLEEQGFGVHPLAVLAASLEHFVHYVAIGRPQLVFDAHGLHMAGGINEGLVDAAVVTFLMRSTQACDTQSTVCRVHRHRASPCH